MSWAATAKFTVDMGPMMQNQAFPQQQMYQGGPAPMDTSAFPTQQNYPQQGKALSGRAYACRHDAAEPHDGRRLHATGNAGPSTACPARYEDMLITDFRRHDGHANGTTTAALHAGRPSQRLASTVSMNVNFTDLDLTLSTLKAHCDLESRRTLATINSSNFFHIIFIIEKNPCMEASNRTKVQSDST